MDHDPLDRVIDQVVRQMTAGDPSSGFATKVLDRVERSVLTPEGPRLIRSPWSFATAGAFALAVVLLFIFSRDSVRRPIPSEPSGVVRTHKVAERAPVTLPGAAETRLRVSPPSIAERRTSEPFPSIPSIAIESINVDPIEMAGIDVAVLEISPIRLEPVGIARQEIP